MLDRPGDALAAYIRRIGAEQKNFRRWVIKAEGPDGYQRVTATIEIVDGDRIECSDEEHAPTPAEAAAIAEELKRVPLPQSTLATEALVEGALRKQTSGELFVFRGASGGVLFVQERILKDDGTKADLPWSYWSDCKWYCMEPDGLLPLYGLDRLKHVPRVFLHEGAKAAARVQRMIDDRVPHPWRKELEGYVVAHLGWPGGAPNPHRVDWEPLKRLSPDIRVIIVADHDRVGEEAVPAISKLLGRSLMWVRFDDHFPDAFDLADPWPSHAEWWRDEKYVGPTLDDMTSPATWATTTVAILDSSPNAAFSA
jgi:hypothetical protein